MKSKYISALLFCIVLIPFIPINCQTTSQGTDKYTLLTMPYNKRPLSLYRGQFQANAGYKFAVNGRSYDSNGDILS